MALWSFTNVLICLKIVESLDDALATSLGLQVYFCYWVWSKRRLLLKLTNRSVAPSTGHFLHWTRQCDQIGRFLHFGQPFKAGGNNCFTQIAHIVRQFLQSCQNHSFFLWNHFWATFIDIWRFYLVTLLWGDMGSICFIHFGIPLQWGCKFLSSFTI